MHNSSRRRRVPHKSKQPLHGQAAAGPQDTRSPNGFISTFFRVPSSKEVMSEYADSGVIGMGEGWALTEQAQENAWIDASQRGDTPAFNSLVLKWEKVIYNLALRMLRDREEAAETTQEIFLSAYRNIRRFRKGSRFSTWLYRIAVNHCITRIRRRPPGIHISLESDETAAKPPVQLTVPGPQDSELLRSEEWRMVRNALALLPADQRTVIELKFFQEMTFEEAAAILDVPLSTIKSRFYTGLETLKMRLGSPD